MISETQIPKSLKEIIDDELEKVNFDDGCDEL